VRDEGVLRLADDYLARGRVDDAIDLLSSRLRSGKRTGPNNRHATILAKAHNAKGTQLLERNRLVESVDQYQKAVELDPRNALYVLHLGNAYFYCATMLEIKSSPKYYTKAIECLNRTIELDRKNVQAYQLLATIYEGLEKTSQARAALIRIREIAPSSHEARQAEQRLKTLSMAK
jgi:tetratricopeptide (TPR) repeat protein